MPFHLSQHYLFSESILLIRGEFSTDLGIQPKQRDSGDGTPKLGITKASNSRLRSLLIQCAHYLLGPFGKGCDLRRWGVRLATGGGKNAKKRAIVAVARKMAVLRHRLLEL